MIFTMKLALFLSLVASALALPRALLTSRFPTLHPRANNTITAAQIPDFGITPGIQSQIQPGSCIGDKNKNIPCSCPPSKAAFASALSSYVSRGKAGDTPIQFSTDFNDQSIPTNLVRVNAMVNTLQNFNFDKSGKSGDGCPAVSAPKLGAIQTLLQQGKRVAIGKN